MEPIKLECEWTVDDFAEGNRLYMRMNPLLNLIPWLSAVVAAVAMGFHPSGKKLLSFGPWFLVPFAVLMISIIAVCSRIGPWLVKKFLKNEAARRKGLSFNITEELIEFRGPDFESKLKWGLFTHWAEGPNLIVLFQHRLMYLLPKRRLEKSQQRALREYLSSKIGEVKVSLQK